ncbi:hypothetical protein Taro_052167 [Colocasia esculenta]|uniref:Uncharacterized protein n=1 Tax=Colocasia esculenta TaxID=4460 RepID=A0A843XIJ8_COLES|nr:hypothetical protein [Colocasia esculenta]
MTDQTPEEVNTEFFQEDFVDDVDLTAHIGVHESKEPICLSKGNEVEEVDPHEIKGSSGSFWSFCASSSGIRLRLVYASSSYGIRIESSHTFYVSYPYDKYEKELKQPPTFHEVFDKTHKKKGTDQYISDRAREVAESDSQQMIEKYAKEEEQPQLDPEVWVAASGAPKKGHVYGFGDSMDTSRVLSGAFSSGSQATSAFTTPGAPSTSPSEMMGFIRDEISDLESHLVHTMHTQVSDAVEAQLS